MVTSSLSRDITSERTSTPASGRLVQNSTDWRRKSICAGRPMPTPAISLGWVPCSTSSASSMMASTTENGPFLGVSFLASRMIRPLRSTSPAAIRVPPTSMPTAKLVRMLSPL